MFVEVVHLTFISSCGLNFEEHGTAEGGRDVHKRIDGKAGDPPAQQIVDARLRDPTAVRRLHPWPSISVQAASCSRNLSSKDWSTALASRARLSCIDVLATSRTAGVNS
jgi:hypothetical protein